MSETETAIVVTEACPYCESLKETLKQKGLLDKVKIINASTTEGRTFAIMNNILAVPECVVIGKNGEKVRVCSEQEFIKLLENEK